MHPLCSRCSKVAVTSEGDLCDKCADKDAPGRDEDRRYQEDMPGYVGAVGRIGFVAPREFRTRALTEDLAPAEETPCPL